MKLRCPFKLSLFIQFIQPWGSNNESTKIFLFFLLSISDTLKYRNHSAHIYILTPYPKNMLETNPVKIDNW